jgi:hypothetical protein
MSKTSVASAAAGAATSPATCWFCKSSAAPAKAAAAHWCGTYDRDFVEGFLGGAGTHLLAGLPLEACLAFVSRDGKYWTCAKCTKMVEGIYGGSL